MKGAPAHPEELAYPCCLSALGELGEVPPRGDLGLSLGDAVRCPDQRPSVLLHAS